MEIGEFPYKKNVGNLSKISMNLAIFCFHQVLCVDCSFATVERFFSQRINFFVINSNRYAITLCSLSKSLGTIFAHSFEEYQFSSFAESQ